MKLYTEEEIIRTVGFGMNKMMFKDIRHLLVIDEKNEEFIGMISIKDLITPLVI